MVVIEYNSELEIVLFEIVVLQIEIGEVDVAMQDDCDRVHSSVLL